MSQLEIRIRHTVTQGGRIAGQPAPGFLLDVSLKCTSGITVLFGSSGSGKTLTLDALAGFYQPAAGRIVLDDAILFDAESNVCLPPQRRHVGYVFQNYALFPHMTIEQNLAFGIQHLPPVERGRRIHEELSRLGISTKSGRLPRELSGGEKQRASIARALICQPRLLLLDEPARGLDYPLRADFYAILRQVRERHQIPILLVTHDAEEGYLLAERMAVLEDGKIVQCAAPSEVFTKPAKPSIARLLGAGNVFSGTIESLDPMEGVSRIRSSSFALILPYLPGRLRGDQVEFCIRREDILLSQSPDVHGSGSALPVEISAESFTPKFVRLGLKLTTPIRKLPVTIAETAAEEAPVTLEAEVTRQEYERMNMRDRRSWFAVLPANSVHVFPPSGSRSPSADNY